MNPLNLLPFDKNNKENKIISNLVDRIATLKAELSTFQDLNRYLYIELDRITTLYKSIESDYEVLWNLYQTKTDLINDNIINDVQNDSN
jgi:hypothetical protein